VESLEGISVIVPAAGVGLRMGEQVPKQYLEVAGKLILEHTISRILALNPKQVTVVVSAEDEIYKSLPSISKCNVSIGGSMRSDSVLAGLRSLELMPNDWVMVHDAVRPCFREADIFELYQRLQDHEVGGVLGVPVADTIKQVNGGSVIETIDRSHLWQAQTPQMFRYSILVKALEDSQKNDANLVTDEASAVEAAGYTPLMIRGHSDNIKVTTPDDLALAGYYLSRESPA
jgi:2-C-methyl-D-erythritol 4-phosphate cytidylyltransferase